MLNIQNAQYWFYCYENYEKHPVLKDWGHTKEYCHQTAWMYLFKAAMKGEI